MTYDKETYCCLDIFIEACMVKGQKKPHSFIITEKLILGQYKYYFSNNADLRYFVHNCKLDLSYTILLTFACKVFYTHFSELG